MNRVEQVAHSLDHYVVYVHELSDASETYRALGFRVSPRMRHIDIRSANHIVLMKNSYLELVGELDNCLPPLRDNVMERFECGEGLAMVSLDSADLDGEHDRVTSLGLGPAPIINARRKVNMPDGTEDETDSTCFYIWRPGRRYLSLFFSEHRNPRAIWIPEHRVHPNTALETTGLTWVSDEPERDRDYFSQLIGSEPVQAEPGRITYQGARGETFEIFHYDRISERYGDAAANPCRALAGYPIGIQIRVDRLSAVESTLEQNGVPYDGRGSSCLVKPEHSHGLFIEFTE